MCIIINTKRYEFEYTEIYYSLIYELKKITSSSNIYLGFSILLVKL